MYFSVIDYNQVLATNSTC